MGTGEFLRVAALFDRLAELPPMRRAAALHEEAEIGEETRRHLRALLHADVELADMTARPAFNSAAALSYREGSYIGQRVGAFMVERELARGGMGSVFLAHCRRQRRAESGRQAAPRDG